MVLCCMYMERSIMTLVRDIELHVAYYVERMMRKDRYKGINPVDLSDHYFSIAMEVDHAQAIRINRSTLSADDYKCFVKKMCEYYNSKPSVWVV